MYFIRGSRFWYIAKNQERKCQTRKKKILTVPTSLLIYFPFHLFLFFSRMLFIGYARVSPCWKAWPSFVWSSVKSTHAGSRFNVRTSMMQRLGFYLLRLLGQLDPLHRGSWAARTHGSAYVCTLKKSCWGTDKTGIYCIFFKPPFKGKYSTKPKLWFNSFCRLTINICLCCALILPD